MALLWLEVGGPRESVSSTSPAFSNLHGICACLLVETEIVEVVVGRLQPPLILGSLFIDADGLLALLLRDRRWHIADHDIEGGAADHVFLDLSELVCLNYLWPLGPYRIQSGKMAVWAICVLS